MQQATANSDAIDREFRSALTLNSSSHEAQMSTASTRTTTPRPSTVSGSSQHPAGQSHVQVLNTTSTSSSVARPQPRTLAQQARRRQNRFVPYTPPSARRSSAQQPAPQSIGATPTQRPTLRPITGEQAKRPRRRSSQGMPNSNSSQSDRAVSPILERRAAPVQRRTDSPSFAAGAPQDENTAPAAVRPQPAERLNEIISDLNDESDDGFP